MTGLRQPVHHRAGKGVGANIQVKLGLHFFQVEPVIEDIQIKEAQLFRNRDTQLLRMGDLRKHSIQAVFL